MIQPLDFAGRKVAVVGLGKSGLATAAALVAAGAKVLLWDDSEAGRAAVVPALGLNPLVDVVAPAAVDWREAAALVMAPGVPLTHPTPHLAAVLARAAGVEIIGEVELLHRARASATQLVGITGSNGKSTTTALVDWILQHGGVARQCGGNLGTPSLSFDPLTEGVYLVEMSSFQLDLVQSARFEIAVWINTSPDHFDRHGDMAGYRAAKRRIFAQQQAGDWAILGVDDPDTAEEAATLAEGPARLVRFTAGDADDASAPVQLFWRDGALIDALDDSDAPVAVMRQSEAPALRGRHNAQNIAAAYAVARALGLAPDVITAAIRSFPGLAHRQERVAESAGVVFVNDSKATNAEATAPALEAYPGAYWILGGKPKVGGIDALAAYFPRIAKAYLIGAAAAEFAWRLGDSCAHEICGDLATATRAAFADARAAGGGTVLLSPACASYDQFKSFEQRGDVFRALARRLAEETQS